jgi:hypothetical protein
MGWRLVSVRRMCEGFGQGMGCVPSWVGGGSGGSGRYVYVHRRCIALVQELVLVYWLCSLTRQGAF